MVAYLDDYIIVADDYVTSLWSQGTLIRLMRELQFAIAYNTVEGSTTPKMVFLGIGIDTNMTVSCPGKKGTRPFVGIGMFHRESTRFSQLTARLSRKVKLGVKFCNVW